MGIARLLTYTIAGKWIKSNGQLLDFEINAIAYSPRNFASNGINKNGILMLRVVSLLPSRAGILPPHIYAVISRSYVSRFGW